MSSTKHYRHGRRGLCRGVVALAAITMLVAADSAAAKTIRVDDASTSVDSEGCGQTPESPTPPSLPCKTITYAVSQATDGDAILVAPGTYPESVVVSKSLQIRGAQAGVDARDRVTPEDLGSESNAQNFRLQASGTTIDGFRLSSPGQFLASVLGESNVLDGYSVINNIIENSAFGIQNQSPGTGKVLIRHNVIRDNNEGRTRTPPDGGFGIFLYGNRQNVVIEENVVARNQSSNINLNTIDDSVVRNNTSILGPTETAALGTFLVLTQSNRTLVEGNVRTAPYNSGTGVFVADGVSDLDIVGNTFTGGSTHVAFSSFSSSSIPATGVRIVGNSLTRARQGIRISTNNGVDTYQGTLVVRHSRLTGNVDAGIRSTASAPNTVDARENFWGCNDGPAKSTTDPAATTVEPPRTPGTCSKVVQTSTGTVTTTPHLVLRAVAPTETVFTGSTGIVRGELVLSDAANGPFAAIPFPATPIGFTATGGTVASTATTQDGSALTAFTAADAPGQASVTADLDGQETPPATFTTVDRQGPQGDPGPPGAPGQNGAPGQTGAPGQNGAPGQTGATGPQGNQGAPGQNGGPGAQGPAGPAGPQGPAGTPGSNGSNGGVLGVRKSTVGFRSLVARRIRNGFVVSITCPRGAGSCEGVVTARSGRIVVGQSRFDVRASKTQRVVVRFPAKRRALGLRIRTVRATATSRAANGVRTQTTRTLRLAK